MTATVLLTAELRALIGNQGTSKPDSWKDISAADVEVNVSTLPVFPEVEVFGYRGNSSIGDDFCAAFRETLASRQFFVIENSHGRFVINTEGYDYAREVLKLRS